MKTKKIVVLVSVLFAVAAIIGGLCLFFFTNKIVHEVPDGVNVQKIDQDYILSTQFSDKYLYNFKIEQKINGEFVLLDIVKSDKNCINLSRQGLDLAADNEFRLSAGFATENGSGDGEFCQPISWSSRFLTDVDYQGVEVDMKTGVVSWEAVGDADFYDLSFVDQDGKSWEFNRVETNEFNLKNADSTQKLKAGKYVLYIVAQSTKENIPHSNAGAGFGGIEVHAQNEIVDISHSDEGIYVTCTQKTNAFQVIVIDFVFDMPFSGEPIFLGDNFVYDLSEFSNFFGGLDLSQHNVKIKALAYGLAEESELFLIK